MTSRNVHSAHRALHLREVPTLNAHIAIALQVAHDLQAREREVAARHRAHASRRSVRHQVGESLIRLGRRLAPEPSHEPAWSR
jgi:hypothetical protein